MFQSLCANDVTQYNTDFYQQHDRDYAGMCYEDDSLPSIFSEPEIELLGKPIVMEDILADVEKDLLPNNEENEDTQNSTGTISAETSDVSTPIPSEPELVAPASPVSTQDSVNLEAVLPPILPA